MRDNETHLRDIPTLAVLVVVALIWGAKLPLVWALVVPMWMLLAIDDLHTRLPAVFFEDHQQARRIVGLSMFWDLCSVVSLGLGRGVGALGVEGLTRLTAPIWLVVAAVAMYYTFRMFRHVLSALKTLETGRLVRETPGMVLFNMLFSPVSIVIAHHRARQVLGAPLVASDPFGRDAAAEAAV